METKRHVRHDESNFQVGIVRMLRYAGFFVFAVPNGQRLNLLRAKLAVREGLTRGVSDLVILLPGRKVFFVEVKNPNKKGYQSAEQKEFQALVEKYGHEYLLWNDWKQVEDFINQYRGFVHG